MDEIDTPTAATRTSTRFRSTFADGTAIFLICAGVAFSSFALPVGAAVPTYEVTVVVPDTGATLRGASPAGHLVGDLLDVGLAQPFVATVDRGLQMLPLPDGYSSGTALDANSSGVVVGSVSGGGFPFDGGEPAIWRPDGSGGYTVHVPEQFETLPSPLGELAIAGGMAVGVNDDGVVVGWSRFFGFQGGPTTQFFVAGPPIDLRTLGFEATVRDLSDTGYIVGDGLRLHLGTGELVDLGVPDPADGTHFTNVIAFSVNDAGESVAAADLASTVFENYLTYVHTAAGWLRLNPNQLPSRFVGFYDNNDLGDVVASGGVLFREENVLVGGFDGLLAEGFENWDVDLGFIDDRRRVATRGFDADTGQTALVLLVPDDLMLFGNDFESGTTDGWSSVTQ